MEACIPYVIVVVGFIIVALWLTARHRRNMKAIRKILDDM